MRSIGQRLRNVKLKLAQDPENISLQKYVELLEAVQARKSEAPDSEETALNQLAKAEEQAAKYARLLQEAKEWVKRESVNGASKEMLKMGEDRITRRTEEVEEAEAGLEIVKEQLRLRLIRQRGNEAKRERRRQANELASLQKQKDQGPDTTATPPSPVLKKRKAEVLELVHSDESELERDVSMALLGRSSEADDLIRSEDSEVEREQAMASAGLLLGDTGERPDKKRQKV